MRNGYLMREFDTRAGTLELAIPKVRAGSYFPDWLLEHRRRAERALTKVVATCYLLGVSTRRVMARNGVNDSLQVRIVRWGMESHQPGRHAGHLGVAVAGTASREVARPTLWWRVEVVGADLIDVLGEGGLGKAAVAGRVILRNS